MWLWIVTVTFIIDFKLKYKRIALIILLWSMIINVVQDQNSYFPITENIWCLQLLKYRTKCFYSELQSVKQNQKKN